MNGSKAKKLRREVYGDQSQRARTYQASGFFMFLEKKIPTGTFRCTGLRAEYQAAKKSRTFPHKIIKDVTPRSGGDKRQNA
jgi:hypothetical protein